MDLFTCQRLDKNHDRSMTSGRDYYRRVVARGPKAPCLQREFKLPSQIITAVHILVLPEHVEKCKGINSLLCLIR